MLVTQITGAQLRSGRAYAGLTLDQVAHRAGVTRQAIGVWELSSAAVPAARVDKLSRVITVLEREGVQFTAEGGVALHRAPQPVSSARAQLGACHEPRSEGPARQADAGSGRFCG
jgi:transcriptional regulator with XRE-family HTH domain